MKKIIYLLIGLLIITSSCNTQAYYVDNVYPQTRTNQDILVTPNLSFYPNSLMWNYTFYDPFFYDLFWNPRWGWNNIYANRWVYPYYSVPLYNPRYTVAPRPSRTVTPSRYERRSGNSLKQQPRVDQPSRTRTENYNRLIEIPSRNYNQSTPSRNYNQSTPSRNYNQSTTPSRNYNQSTTPSRNSNQSTTPSRNSNQSTTPSRRSGNN